MQKHFFTRDSQPIGVRQRGGVGLLLPSPRVPEAARLVVLLVEGGLATGRAGQRAVERARLEEI